MKNFRFDMRFVLGIALSASFVVALAFYLVYTPARVERVLFFPGSIGRELSGETRLVPRQSTLERSVSTLVQELTYGPARIDRSRIVPRTARVTSVMVRGRTAYIDISPRILDEDGSVNLSLEESLAALEHSIRYNFRGLDRVVLTVGGEMLRRQPTEA